MCLEHDSGTTIMNYRKPLKNYRSNPQNINFEQNQRKLVCYQTPTTKSWAMITIIPNSSFDQNHRNLLRSFNRYIGSANYRKITKKRDLRSSKHLNTYFN